MNPLFKGMSRDELAPLLEILPVSISRYQKGDILLNQGEEYHSLCLLLSGNCYSRMLDFKGRELKIENFSAPSVFAPAVLFAQNNDMPGSVITVDDVEIVSLSREAVLDICSRSRNFLENYLSLLSNKFMFISRRLEAMSFTTIREKLANYLLGLKADSSGKIELPMSLEELSGFFGVSRPSLSRVFSQLERQNVIQKKKKRIHVLDIDALIADAPDE